MIKEDKVGNNEKQCFICTNMGIKQTKVVGNYFGFPICKPHAGFLDAQETKAEAAGNPVWKEIWDDSCKDRLIDVESAINSIIVLRGYLKNLPKDVMESIKLHKLEEKYSEYL
jgi:hypothetical protein